jgi:hypothetical protein
MDSINIKELIEHLEKLQRKADLIRGSQKVGIGSSWWDGKTQGIKECIEYLKKL